MNNTTVGERIKEARKKRQMSLVQLGDIVGVKWQTIQKYENGLIKAVPLFNITKIAHALCVPPSELAGFDYMKSDEDLGCSALNEPLPETDVVQNTLDRDEQEILNLWRAAPLKTKMEVYSLLTKGDQ